MALGISNLRCLLDIQVEISGRQLAMRVRFGEMVQDKDINFLSRSSRAKTIYLNYL